MAAPVTGDPNLPPQNSDRYLIQHRSPPQLTDEDFTISQLIRPNNYPPNPPPPSPLTSSLGKRRKSTPLRYGVYTTIGQKTHQRHNTEVEDSSSKSLSSPIGNSASKNVKSKIKSPPALIKAGEVQSSLGSENPSCIKMVKAHADTGYWMGFPQWFGKLFLPKTDCEMVIEDENGETDHIKYIAEKRGLSAGWKKFAVAHNLLEGDVLVFHLVESKKFKVYIIRANDLNKVDGALSLLNSEANKRQMTSETETPSATAKKHKRVKALPSTIAQKEHKLSTPTSQIISHRVKQSGNNDEETVSENLEGSRTSKPNLSLQELKTFKDFHIMVKGVCIDSELPDDVRMLYFKLCMKRKEFLHDSLSENFYYKLVAGMIGETVNIAKEIRNCTLTTVTKEEFEAWDNSLKSFAQLGMKVGFLRDKIATLSKIRFESEGSLDIERYVEAKKQHKHAEAEMKRLAEEIKRLEEHKRKTQGVLDGLEEKVRKYKVKLQEELNEPWLT